MGSVKNIASIDSCTTTVNRKDVITQGPEIVDVTLYNSHVFAQTMGGSDFDHKIVQALDRLGVEYTLLHNPSISNELVTKCAGLCLSKLTRSKIISEKIGCDVDEARFAVRLGVQGLQMRIPYELSALQHEAWKSANANIVYFARANKVQVLAKIQNVFTRELGEVLTMMQELRMQGASHIKTSVLEIGQRDGIIPLGGYFACLIVTNRDRFLATYGPKHFPGLETVVLEAFGLDLPLNNYITGFCTFNHKAGIHIKAVLNNLQTYESIRPGDFGVSRNVQYASRLTGWHAIKPQAEQMDLTMTDDQCRSCTEIIKSMANQRTISNQEVDRTIGRSAENVSGQDSSILH